MTKVMDKPNKSNPSPKSGSTFKKIGIASFIMMASVFTSRVIGLAREMAIAYKGGAGGGVDAYQVAFIIPEILNHIVASGFLSVTFIPIFATYLSQNNEEQGWRVFSIVFNTFSLILLIFLAAAFYFAPLLVSILAPGFTDPALFKQAVKMTRIIMPAQFFFFSGGLFMAVQFAKEKFIIPALAPLVYNAGIIAGGIGFSSIMGMEGFAWGVLGGAFAGNFVLQYMGAKKIGMKIYPMINLKDKDFIKYVVLTLPLMVGLTMTFSTEILLKYFGSFLSQGSIAALNYALRIMFILVGLSGQALGVASYPFMARLAADGKIRELNHLLNQSLKLLFLVIPLSVLFMVLRHEIVFLLFQRGRFDDKATTLTAGILPWILSGTFAFAAQTVVVRGYYAMQNTWFPAVVGTLSVIGSLPVFYFFMIYMGTPGVALSMSLTAMGQTLLLFHLWNKKSHNTEACTVYIFFMKILFLSMLISIILWKITGQLQYFFNGSTLAGALFICFITGLFFVVLLWAAGYLFKIEELSVVMKRVKNFKGSKNSFSKG